MRKFEIPEKIIYKIFRALHPEEDIEEPEYDEKPELCQFCGEKLQWRTRITTEKIKKQIRVKERVDYQECDNQNCMRKR